MYTSVGKLENFGRVEPMLDATRRTVDRVGDELLHRTVELTPVAKAPPGAEAEWLAARKRAPGSLKESWQRTVVEMSVDGRTATVEVYTNDPIAPFVEYPTLPHLIMPKRPGGWLRFWNRFGGIVFARLVHHPGTAGSYMLTNALAELVVGWQEIGREEMERWAGEQARLVAA